MRVVVTGKHGQIVTALKAAAVKATTIEVLAVGRPELDLTAPDAIENVLAALKPDVIVNAAAYTAVDKAEADEPSAMAINCTGAGAVALASEKLCVPIIQLSTDYVFDGAKSGPYFENDPVAPLGVYGLSKLKGEQAVANANPDHVILRTAWVFSAHGNNFVRTMLRLASDRPEVSVVADQYGCPSYADDLAAAILKVAENLIENTGDIHLRGVFHVAGCGETTWADFADHIFLLSRQRGGPGASVKRIRTADYPTAAKRPANSRLSCEKLRKMHGIRMPHWEDALSRCIDRLIFDGEAKR